MAGQPLRRETFIIYRLGFGGSPAVVKRATSPQIFAHLANYRGQALVPFVPQSRASASAWSVSDLNDLRKLQDDLTILRKFISANSNRKPSCKDVSNCPNVTC
jgi:hypothetical protein